MQQSLKAYGGPYPTRRTLTERIEYHYKKGVTSGVAYHEDLNPSNILVDGEKITLIDWTGATWDDPFVDLALLANLSNLERWQEKALLRAYFGRTCTENELQELNEVKR